MTQWRAIDMAQAIRNKEISSLELVEQTIERANALNPSLNAIVSNRYEQALQEAREQRYAEGPFAGVPLYLKDLGQELEGDIITSGSRLFRSYRAKQTDHLVARLKALGFIFMGRTNAPEFGFKNISDASLHGSVHLPDDLSRNAGGSSGGAAALVAAGVAPLAMASDGGGSIRIPASFNGLVGLKPSRGRMPVGPGSYRGWQGASVHFALSRHVSDSRALFYHLQTQQMESPFTLPVLSRDALSRRSSKSLRIALLRQSPIGGKVSKEALEALDKAAGFLRAEGHELEEISSLPIDGVQAMRSYYLMNSVETAAMFQGIEKNLGRQLDQDDMELMTWALYQAGLKLPATDYSNLLNQWDGYSAAMEQFHQEFDLLLSPTVADVAPPEGIFALSDSLKDDLAKMASFSIARQQDLIWQMFDKSLNWTPFTQQANLTGQPAISLPVYRRSDGLSIGVQLTAAKGREDLLFNLAEAFEEAGQFV